MAEPYESPIPGGVDYARAELEANNAYKQALARLNDQRMSSLRQFGYAANIDPSSGVLTNMHVDPNNPFGAYQQLLGNSADAADMARQQAFARGIGIRGLGAQDVQRTHRQFEAGSAQLGTSLTDTLKGYQDAQTTAAQERDRTLYEAKLEAARQAILNQLFNPANFEGVQYPEYGGGASIPDAGSSAPPRGPSPAELAIVSILNPPDSSRVGGRVGISPQHLGSIFDRPAPAPRPAPASKKDTRPKQVVYKGRH